MPKETGGRYFSPARELKEFRETVKRYKQRPPNSDPYVGSYFDAVDTDWELIEPSIAEGFRFKREDLRRPAKPKQYPNLVQRASFKQILRLDPSGWPAQIEDDKLTVGYTDPQAYREMFPKFLPQSDEEIILLENEFVRDICIRAVMSNVVERSKSLQLLLVAYGDRIGPEPRIGDFGCSANYWLMARALRHELPPVDVFSPNKGKLVKDVLATNIVNSALNVHPQIGKSVGFDEWNWPRDFEIREWTQVCTITPAERAISLKIDNLLRATDGVYGGRIFSPLGQYEYLGKQKSSLVDFAQLDITNDLDVMKFQENEQYSAREFDLVNTGTTLHQLSPERRTKFLSSMDRLKSSPSVLKVVVDFARRSPDNPFELEVEEDIYDGRWLYRMMVLDPLNPEGWQEMLIFETGRCARVQLGLGRICVNGELRTIGEQLGL